VWRHAAYSTGQAQQDEGQHYVYFGEGSGCLGGSVTVKYNYGRDGGSLGLSGCVQADDNTQMSAFGNVCTGVTSAATFAAHGGGNTIRRLGTCQPRLCPVRSAPIRQGTSGLPRARRPGRLAIASCGCYEGCSSGAGQGNCWLPNAAFINQRQ
jgi:hypothetical protein